MALWSSQCDFHAMLAQMWCAPSIDESGRICMISTLRSNSGPMWMDRSDCHCAASFNHFKHVVFAIFAVVMESMSLEQSLGKCKGHISLNMRLVIRELTSI